MPASQAQPKKLSIDGAAADDDDDGGGGSSVVGDDADVCECGCRV